MRDNGTATVGGMYWVDKTIQHFFEKAEKEGLMDDRTLFIVTADHNPIPAVSTRNWWTIPRISRVWHPSR